MKKGRLAFSFTYTCWYFHPSF